MQAFGAPQQTACDRLRACVGDAYAMRLGFPPPAGAVLPALPSPGFASVVAVLWIGATECVVGRMTAGTLIAVHALLRCWRQLARRSFPRSMARSRPGGWCGGAALGEILAEKPVIAVAGPSRRHARSRRAASVRFEHVTFRYPVAARLSGAHNVSISRSVREKRVALVGPSGAGKSHGVPIAAALLRSAGGTRPVRRRDDVPEADPRRSRSHIALVPQDPTIFSGYDPRQHRYGRPDATPAEVEARGGAAAADEFIRRLPDGYDTEARRARRDAVRWPAPAHRHCARDPAATRRS